MDVVEAAAAPASDVLPTGVRRRLSRRDAWLPLVLTGELVAGMLLGMAWHVVAVPEGGPPAAVRLATADRAPDSGAGGSATAVPPTAVPPTAVPPTAVPAPPPLRTEPRNPFAMQVG